MFLLKVLLGFIHFTLIATTCLAMNCNQFLEVDQSIAISSKNPEYLLAALPPSFEDLTYNLDPGKYGLVTDYINDKNLNLKFYKEVLNIFRVIHEDADYYFVGNGFYIPYLIAKSLFSGTSLESRIKFMAFSRGLVKKALNFRGSADRYFESLGIGVQERKIIIIDSLSDHLDVEINGNSLLQLQLALINYLMREKGLNQKEALASVVVVGYPELQIPKAPFEVDSLSTYNERIRDLENSVLANTQLPYIKIGNTSPFMQFYSRDGSTNNWLGAELDLYWNGKFNDFDEDEMPKGNIDIQDLHESGRLKDFEKEINLRLRRAGVYSYIISESLKIKSELLQQEIQDVLNANGY
jgi:hypothetical protein